MSPSCTAVVTSGLRAAKHKHTQVHFRLRGLRIGPSRACDSRATICCCTPSFIDRANTRDLSPERKKLVSTNRRSPLTKTLQVAIFKRDSWLCRWCGRPVIFPPVMKYIEIEVRKSGHSGELAYYHPHWTRAAAPLLARILQMTLNPDSPDESANGLRNPLKRLTHGGSVMLIRNGRQRGGVAALHARSASR